MDVIVNILFLLISGYDIKLQRIILASFVERTMAVIMLIVPFFEGIQWFVYIMCGMLSVRIITEVSLNNIILTIKLTAIWYLTFFVAGGYIDFVLDTEVTIGRLVLSVSILLVVFYIFIGNNKLLRLKTVNSNIYKVTVIHGNKSIHSKGYYDSGCRLYEPVSGFPCIVASYDNIENILSAGEKEYINMFPKIPEEWDGETYIRNIPYVSIGKDKGHLPGIRLDGIVIEKDGRSKHITKAYAAIYKGNLSKTDDYSYLLNSDMKL